MEDAVYVLPGRWSEGQAANTSTAQPAELDSARPSWPRRLLTAFGRRLAARWPTIKRTLPRDLAIATGIAVLTNYFALAYIATDSVHTSVALVLKGVRPQPGEMAVFAYSGQAIEGYYANDGLANISRHFAWITEHEVSLAGPRKGDGFVKYLVGTPGDRIERVGRDFYLHTQRGRLFVGHAKTHSQRGIALQAADEQVIPDGFVYVWAPHPDALDSRYAAVGLVPASAIVGKAVPLW